MRELGATHLLFNDAAKGVTSAAEAANRRITNLLRRSIGDKLDGDWTAILKQTVYALNACSFLYAKTGTISSPSYLQHARHPYCPNTEVSELTTLQREHNVRCLMAKICKERNIDAPSLHQQVSARRERFKTRPYASTSGSSRSASYTHFYWLNLTSSGRCVRLLKCSLLGCTE